MIIIITETWSNLGVLIKKEVNSRIGWRRWLTVFLKLSDCLILNHESTKNQGKKLLITDMLTLNNEKSHSPSPQEKTNEQTNKTNESPQGPNSETSSFPATEFLFRYLICLQVSLTTLSLWWNLEKWERKTKRKKTHTLKKLILLYLNSTAIL